MQGPRTERTGASENRYVERSDLHTSFGAATRQSPRTPLDVLFSEVLEPDDILIVIKEFPILAESSVLAAKAALAAEEQNKFLEYHLALMNSVGSITEDSLKSIAIMVGLNMEQFTAAISSNKFDRILRRNIDSGRAIGIEGTPALLIGKKIIPGAISLKEIMAIIDSERNKN